MKIYTDQSLIRKNTYKDYWFLENKINNDEQLWNGYFDNKPITKESKIIYTGILDSEKGILKCGWSVFPCIYTLLGFIQHVFLPTCFLTCFDRKCDGFFIPVSTFDIVINEVTKNNPCNTSSINSMIDAYNRIDSFWDFKEDLLLLKLKCFCKNFNNKWDNDPNQKLFIKIFNSPENIYPFIKRSIQWDFEEFVKEEISISLNDLEFTCNNVLNEPLLNKKFIHILNSNMSILF